MNGVQREESPLSDCPSPSPKLPKESARTPATENVSKDAVVNDIQSPSPKRRNLRKKASTKLTTGGTAGNDEKPKPTKSRKRKAPSDEDPPTQETEDGVEGISPTKRRRRRKTPENERVYQIEPIKEVLTTTFKGRLGYACLNTILRASHPASIFCSRTCRLSTISTLGASHLRSLGLANARDLLTLIEWNAQHGIHLFRMSSEMFPFASHPVHGYTLEFANTELKKAGERARELNVRVTSHPGQFTQLGSPRKEVVKNAVRDLECEPHHCEIMDRMGLDQDSVMIIHMGGTFGDKPATLNRFRENYTTLLSPSIKARLVLENDELCYTVDDLLPISRELNIPIIFDYHHDWLNPSKVLISTDNSAERVEDGGIQREGGWDVAAKAQKEPEIRIRPPQELIPLINEVWHRKGIKPKQHYSEPRKGAVSVMEKRAHSDRVAKLPDGLPDDMDLMLECKDKEQAVFYIYRLYGLKEVEHSVLRPPASEESLATKGRKSSKKRAKGKKNDGELEDQAELLDTVDDDDGAEYSPQKSPRKRASLRKSVTTSKRSPRKRPATPADEEEDEIKRVADEHGLSPDEAEEAVEEVGGGVDCGSGDEVVEMRDEVNFE